ncbi:uncharacterized protein [Miscanthus floridulus]|uniref:uncharacterized protein n=1 Tax=Miscanthus floridulus TaxID=154761 RepID=UPI00345B0607
MDDREWMYTGFSSQTLLTEEWINTIDAFLEWAFARVKGASVTWCPCSKFANTHRQTKLVMGKHLCKNGFTTDYTRWIYHGEADRGRDEVVRQRIEEYDGDAGVGDITIDMASTPTLSQIRASSMSVSPVIRPRPTTTQFQMEALQTRVEAETKQREEMEARMEEMIQQRVADERQNMEEEQWRMMQRIEEENRLRMDQMFQYI